jgi:hypothetical protein
LTIHLHLLQRIKLCGAVLPLTHTSFWCGVYMSTWTNSKALSLPNAKVGEGTVQPYLKVSADHLLQQVRPTVRKLWKYFDDFKDENRSRDLTNKNQECYSLNRVFESFP